MRYWPFILVLGIVFVGCTMIYESDDSDAVDVYWNATVGQYFYQNDDSMDYVDDCHDIQSLAGLDISTGQYGFGGVTISGTPQVAGIYIGYAYVFEEATGNDWEIYYYVTVSNPSFTVSVYSAGGGTVSGGGTYVQGNTATITATPNTGYHFTNWSDGDTNASRTFTVTGNVSLTAYFAINTYTIAWNNWDGARLETDSSVPYGSTPSYNGNTPTRPSTSQYSYTFSGRSPAINTVTGNQTYTAQYTEIALHTVVWKNWNGTILETDLYVPEGTLPTYDGTTPTGPETSEYSYNFDGWSPAVVPVTTDAEYTAQFSHTYREYTDGEWAYGILDSGYAILLDYTGSGGTVQIPVIVGGMTVSNIGDALKDNESVTGVVIPSNIKSITYDAFSGTSITEVLNLSELNITGLSYGLDGATIHTSIPGWFYISDVEYTDRVPDNSSVSKLIRIIPLLILIGVIVMIARNRVEDE